MSWYFGQSQNLNDLAVRSLNFINFINKFRQIQESKIEGLNKINDSVGQAYVVESLVLSIDMATE